MRRAKRTTAVATLLALTPHGKTAAKATVAWPSAQLPFGVRLDAPIQLRIEAGPTVDLVAQICLPYEKL